MTVIVTQHFAEFGRPPARKTPTEESLVSTAPPRHDVAPLPAASAPNPFLLATFVMSAAKLEQLPDDAVPELAFVGRSNSGKSSALNMLCNKKALARVSKTPGRTQLINLFDVPGARLIDLPGYGFAKVPGAIRKDWGKLIGGYLEVRSNLQLLIVIMDIRHPITDLDEQMLDWAKARNRPCHVLLTKADKLAKGAAGATLLQVRAALKHWGEDFTAQLFSSHNALGVDEARATIHAHVLRAHGAAGIGQ